MSIGPIPGNVQQPLSSASAAAAAPLQTEAALQAAAIPPKNDTVELTATAQAKSLKLAGQTPAQIALKMGVDIKTVDSYLSIKAPAPTMPATTAPVAPVATAGKPAATEAAAPPQPAQEAQEPAAEKATETVQGKK